MRRWIPLVLAAACSGSPARPAERAPAQPPAVHGPACRRDADCGDRQACAFAIADGCQAIGECVPRTGPRCNSLAPGCTCDGTTISGLGCDGLAAGFAARPLAHAGACP